MKLILRAKPTTCVGVARQLLAKQINNVLISLSVEKKIRILGLRFSFHKSIIYQDLFDPFELIYYSLDLKLSVRI